MSAPAGEEQKKKRGLGKKFSYRGVDLDKLLDMSINDLMELLPARQRRKFSRGISRGPNTVLKKLRVAKKGTPYGEKPPAVKTHLRNMVIVPEMIGSIVAIYNGKHLWFVCFLSSSLSLLFFTPQQWKNDVVSFFLLEHLSLFLLSICVTRFV